MSDTRLYVIPGSHPAMTVRLMLEAKGIPYKRTDLMPVVAKPVARAVGFPGGTVPGAQDRRREAPRQPRDRPCARPHPARAAALSRRPAERIAVEEADGSARRTSSPRPGACSGGAVAGPRPA